MVPADLQVSPRVRPVLDEGFVPAALWNRAFQEAVEASGRAGALEIALERPDGSVSRWQARVFAHQGREAALNERFVERLVKFLLWQRGGNRVLLSGDPTLAAHLQQVYSPRGVRAFDYEFMGERIFGRPMQIEHVSAAHLPPAKESTQPLGRHLDGCRIGFDLGGSDRKCAAVRDGEVLFTEEVSWDPYFQTDPQYHFDGINDSLRRAAARLPRVDAIGGSAAGVYVNNEVRVASLFRGVSADGFETRVRRIFRDLQKAWGDIPFVVVNDGEVTALAGSMALGRNGVLGVAMGTSLAGGYVNPDGNITDWLDELAFVPVDYRRDAPADEWSGDLGVGVQYFSQQAVARLIPVAGIEVVRDAPVPERLVEVQRLMEKGDGRARKIYETIGVYFGYTIAHYLSFYELKNILVLGRVMSGAGGDVILNRAQAVLKLEFPEAAEKVQLVTPGETEKRHGQAVAAASLPVLAGSRA